MFNWIKLNKIKFNNTASQLSQDSFTIHKNVYTKKSEYTTKNFLFHYL